MLHDFRNFSTSEALRDRYGLVPLYWPNTKAQAPQNRKRVRHARDRRIDTQESTGTAPDGQSQL